MRVSGLVLIVATVLGCGGAGDITKPDTVATKKPKPDPYVTIRVSDLMDTTTRPGRAHWHMYVLLSGPYDAQNGIAYQGNIGINDMQLNHNIRCVSVGADSVGQRLLSVVALADTSTEAFTPDATALSLINAWYAGNHVLPSGWMALSFPPTDAWVSAQYNAGHGLTQDDPIKWGFDWTGAGSTNFYERTDTDSKCGTFLG